MTNLNVPGLDLPAYMREVGESARTASRLLARAPTAAKNAALEAIAVPARSARLKRKKSIVSQTASISD